MLDTCKGYLLPIKKVTSLDTFNAMVIIEPPNLHNTFPVILLFCDGNIMI